MSTLFPAFRRANEWNRRISRLARGKKGKEKRISWAKTMHCSFPFPTDLSFLNQCPWCAGKRQQFTSASFHVPCIIIEKHIALGP